MPLNEAMLPEFDQEMANTRKALERVPEDKLDWKPHEKSFSMLGLTTHLSSVPSWVVHTIAQDSLDIAPAEGEPPRAEPVTSVEHALEVFDDNVTKARAALAGAADAHLLAPWSLLQGGEVMFKMPRIAVLRGMVMNHMIHHRGQLSVYLRLNDVPVPSIYGPTADEAP